MPGRAGYLFMVAMDVAKDKEALFYEVYDTEHVPHLAKVPGVRGITRWKTEPAAVNIGGERKPLDGAGQAHYLAIYELDSPDVLLSPAWAAAVETGRWPTEVRPYTTNRSHVLRKAI
jgi:hypothetical protein